MIPRLGVGQNPKINKEIPHPSTFNQCICVYIYIQVSTWFSVPIWQDCSKTNNFVALQLVSFSSWVLGLGRCNIVFITKYWDGSHYNPMIYYVLRYICSYLVAGFRHQWFQFLGIWTATESSPNGDLIHGDCNDQPALFFFSSSIVTYYWTIQY